MIKVAIIHGTGGSPEGNWYPWLVSELSNRDLDVVVPRMPTPEGQSLTNWLASFQRYVGAIDSDTILIGHSVGAVFLLRLLERVSRPVRGSVFVAGFTGQLGIAEYDILNSTFVDGAYDWSSIRQNAGLTLCFSGSDDPYVPLTQGLELAKNLGVEPYIIEGGGHLNAESGYLSFPLLLSELTKLGVSGKLQSA